MYAYGADVGGSSVKIGFAEVSGAEINLIRRFEIKTNTENAGEAILKDLALAIDKDIVENGLTKDMIAGVGIGVPGPVLPDGTVNKCINLGWGVFNVEQEFSNLCGLKTRAGNDANVAALGEMAFGAGRGYEDLVMVTLGTGIGGGIVLGGRIFKGSTGAGGEIGHMHVNDAESEPCTCGNYGCLEQYASATGIVRLYESKIGRGGMMSLSGMTGLTCKDVFANAKSGNGKAMAAIDDAADYLGKALANVAAVVNPQIFVLGGGVMNEDGMMLEKIRESFKKYAFHACRKAKIEKAQLGNDAGIYGAAFLATLG